MKKAILVLSDGTTYEGTGFGAESVRVGELVFCTGMTGYQEALTDPSYAGQILAMCYPLIGNYGVSADDSESKHIWVEGFAVREACAEPQHARSVKTIDRFLEDEGTGGISGIDTRALVRRIRSHGVMPAAIAVYDGKAPDAGDLLAKARALDYGKIDFVERVSCKNAEELVAKKEERRVVLLDCGAKGSIAKELLARNVSVTIVPAKTSSEQILSYEPDGLLVSNGPGDPALLGYAIATLRELLGKLPVFGVCLGHQILTHAVGGSTYKLKFGHRGANHPVKELRSGRITITTQNHGYASDAKSLPKGVEITHVNCNDGTVEGMRCIELPAFSVQYHPEANPGPYDSKYLFDTFKEMMK